MNGYVNKQNGRIREDTSPYEIQERPMHSEKVLCGVDFGLARIYRSITPLARLSSSRASAIGWWLPTSFGLKWMIWTALQVIQLIPHWTFYTSDLRGKSFQLAIKLAYTTRTHLRNKTQCNGFIRILHSYNLLLVNWWPQYCKKIS